LPFLPRLQQIERAYEEFNYHLMDSVERERRKR